MKQSRFMVSVVLDTKTIAGSCSSSFAFCSRRRRRDVGERDTEKRLEKKKIERGEKKKMMNKTG